MTAIDLRVRIDFFGRFLTVGEHEFCFWDLVAPDKRLHARLAQSRGVDVVGEAIDVVRKQGWDMRRVPYDPETNPECDKMRLHIYLDENNCITKTRPTS